jgi:hypothetical protein
MGEWVQYLAGSICLLLAAAQLAAGLWAFTELRKRRSVPEFFGLDWLDIVFRVERQFGVSLTVRDFECFPPEALRVLTAGQLWDAISAKLQTAGREVPLDGWEQIVAALSEALNVKAKRITSGSRLYADLGMQYGF